MSNQTSNRACPRCRDLRVTRNGHLRGRQRYHCAGCGAYFGETEGTVMYRLQTPAAEVAQALLVVMRRGSLRGAAEITGHNYETIGTWLRRAGEQAQALTEALVHDLHLSTVEVDEFWSFVQKKTRQRANRSMESGGDA